jgi:hypothetical protein
VFTCADLTLLDDPAWGVRSIPSTPRALSPSCAPPSPHSDHTNGHVARSHLGTAEQRALGGASSSSSPKCKAAIGVAGAIGAALSCVLLVSVISSRSRSHGAAPRELGMWHGAWLPAPSASGPVHRRRAEGAPVAHAIADPRLHGAANVAQLTDSELDGQVSETESAHGGVPLDLLSDLPPGRHRHRRRRRRQRPRPCPVVYTPRWAQTCGADACTCCAAP